ncbi:MAG: periplasmic/membrane thiol peroxidase [Puniceicoccaceae bacterium 5H]|nr:MAG: periplasmic/membrane thiol peroxidase [Puniceicoccaceae bacterium 5H]
MRLPQLFWIFLLTATTSLFANVKNGEHAPDFTLKNTQGEEVSLHDYEGKYVVLEWVNPGCPFVQKHYNSGNMQKLQAKAEGMDVVWLSINSTSPKSGDYLDASASSKWYQEHDVKSQWLLDPEGKASKAYGAVRTPHMFIINPQGNVIYQGAIDSINSADPADIEKADNYVMDALKEATDGKNVSIAQTRPYGCTVKQ